MKGAGFALQVQDTAAVANTLTAMRETFAAPDILVNNAGTTKFVDHSDLHGLNSSDFQHIYGVNVIGSYQMIRAVSEQMQSQEDGGAVVNVASTAAITGIGRRRQTIATCCT